MLLLIQDGCKHGGDSDVQRDENFKLALSGLEIVTQNIMAGNPKHRTVRTGNNAFKKRVFRHDGAHACLDAIGFVKSQDPKSEHNSIYSFRLWNTSTCTPEEEESDKIKLETILNFIKELNPGNWDNILVPPAAEVDSQRTQTQAPRGPGDSPSSSQEF